MCFTGLFRKRRRCRRLNQARTPHMEKWVEDACWIERASPPPSPFLKGPRLAGGRRAAGKRRKPRRTTATVSTLDRGRGRGEGRGMGSGWGQAQGSGMGSGEGEQRRRGAGGEGQQRRGAGGRGQRASGHPSRRRAARPVCCSALCRSALGGFIRRRRRRPFVGLPRWQTVGAALSSVMGTRPIRPCSLQRPSLPCSLQWFSGVYGRVHCDVPLCDGQPRGFRRWRCER